MVRCTLVKVAASKAPLWKPDDQREPRPWDVWDAITDGERILEIFHVQDMAYELEDQSYAQGNHSADMLMLRRHHTQGSAYFPPQLVSAGSTSVAQTHVNTASVPYSNRLPEQPE